MTSEDKDEERRYIIGQLEYRYQQAQAKHLKAEADAAEAMGEFAELQAARRRSQLPLPEGDICVPCWVNHGRISNFEALTADEPERYDRMRCEGCKRIEDREIEL